MMEKAAVYKNGRYVIDLIKIEGEGALPCPKCGILISPDDDTDDVYQILQTKVKNGQLEALTLKCNKCGTVIKLVGFIS